MAEVTLRDANPSLATVVSYPNGGTATEHQITGLECGEDIGNGDFVYIDNTDGMVYIADGSAADQEAEVCGIVLIGNEEGKTVTIWHGVNVHLGPQYANGDPVAAGKKLYLSGTNPGKTADAASTGGTRAIARVLDTDGRVYIAPAV